MKIPKSVKLLALYFHPDSLYGDGMIEKVLEEFVAKHGQRQLRKVQEFMKRSLETNDDRLMQDQWLSTDSGIDFQDGTAEFFKTVFDFVPL